MSGQLNSVAALKLAVAAAVTASGNGSSVDLLAYDGNMTLTLNSAATNGANVTLDVKIQHSSDNSTWSDSGVAFSQVTNAAASFQNLYVTSEQFKRYIRVVDTVAGTSPSVPRAVTAVAKAAR